MSGKILKAENKTKKVGESNTLKLEEHILYFPKRYTPLKDDNIKEMIDAKFNIRKGNDNLD